LDGNFGSRKFIRFQKSFRINIRKLFDFFIQKFLIIIKLFIKIGNLLLSSKHFLIDILQDRLLNASIQKRYIQRIQDIRHVFVFFRLGESFQKFITVVWINNLIDMIHSMKFKALLESAQHFLSFNIHVIIMFFQYYIETMIFCYHGIQVGGFIKQFFDFFIDSFKFSFSRIKLENITNIFF